MGEKSLPHHSAKKAGKSIKQKRAEKHAKQEAKGRVEIIPHEKKR